MNLFERDKKRMNKSWFARGGRHSLNNRISDLKVFIPQHSGKFSALDIGCAEGNFALWLSRRFKSVTGIEYSGQLFNAAKELTSAHANIEVQLRDIGQEPLNTRFDFIFLLGVLHYLDSGEHRERVIDNIFRFASEMVFIRTAVRENRCLPDESHRRTSATSLSTLIGASRRNGFRWVFVDNRYRGEEDYRLGDLFVAKRINDGSLTPIELSASDRNL